MKRGTLRFKCNECQSIFRGPDIEYACSAYSTPLKCPKCGSMHTYPCSLMADLLPSLCHPDINAYKEIWAKMDEESKKEE